ETSDPQRPSLVGIVVFQKERVTLRLRWHRISVLPTCFFPSHTFSVISLVCERYRRDTARSTHPSTRHSTPPSLLPPYISSLSTSSLFHPPLSSRLATCDTSILISRAKHATGRPAETNRAHLRTAESNSQ